MNDLPDQNGKEGESKSLSSENLAGILCAHQEWLDSKGKVGTRANLSDTNLRYIDLSGKNLRAAILEGTNLKFAQLKNANLQDSSLANADLSEAKGLLEEQLAGCNLTGTKLPSHVGKFESLSRISDLTKNCKQLNITIILACLYSWLTIANTTDSRLLTNSIFSPLPIIQTEIPIAGFFWVAPFLLLCLYFWFHVNLQEYWKSLSKMPAVFPDGIALDEKTYPWIFVALLRANSLLLKMESQSLKWLMVRISIILAWYLVPISIYIFWQVYLSSRDKIGIIILAYLLVLAMAFGWYSYCLAISTIRHEPLTLLLNRKYPTQLTNPIGYIMSLILFVFVMLVSFKALGEKPIGFYYLFNNYAILVEEDVSKKPDNWDGKEVFLVKGASLVGKDLQNALAQNAFFVMADLRGANLGGAKIAGANFQKANLLGANLERVDGGWGDEINRGLLEYREISTKKVIIYKMVESNSGKPISTESSLDEYHDLFIYGGNFAGTNFREANLDGANLRQSILIFANFQRANLRSTNMSNADLRFSEFTDSKLHYANLRGANLSFSNLTGAYLLGADLEKADLTFSKLQNVTFKSLPIPKITTEKERAEYESLTKDLNFPRNWGGNLKEANFEFSDMRGSNLTGVNFEKANLLDVNLENAILYNANLKEAILNGANVRNANFLLSRLQGTDLSEVKGLTQEQINLACLNKATILPEGLKRPKPCEGDTD